MFVTAAGAIGGMLAIGLLYHLVRCYILRKHWRDFAAVLIGDDGLQLAENGAMLQAGHERSDDQAAIPIVDEELSVRLGLPSAPPDNDDDDGDDDGGDDGQAVFGGGDGQAQDVNVHAPASGLPTEPPVNAASASDPAAASDTGRDDVPLDGEEPASDPASSPSEEELDFPRAQPLASAPEAAIIGADSGALGSVQ